jgi:hypothetical protein
VNCFLSVSYFSAVVEKGTSNLSDNKEPLVVEKGTSNDIGVERFKRGHRGLRSTKTKYTFALNLRKQYHEARTNSEVLKLLS